LSKYRSWTPVVASSVVADKSKGNIFHDFLPLLNGQLVELLDRKAGIVQERAISQLLALERTVSKQGKDSIGLTKDVEPSEVARQGRGAASRAARFPVRQCGMGQRTRQIRVITQLAQGSLSKNR
jgi:hypothetical protein